MSQEIKQHLCSVMVSTSTCLVEGPGSNPGRVSMPFFGKDRPVHIDT